MSRQQKRMSMIRLPQVMGRVGLSKPSIYRLMKVGKFPKARLIGERAVGWIEDEIDEFVSSRKVAG